MAHDSEDVGVDINDYLAALGKYNLQYGGNQGNRIVSSTEAPGFAYQNPQTQETYPLYPPQEGGGQRSGFGFGDASKGFENYLTSIGAEKAHVGSPHIVGNFSDPMGMGTAGYYTDTRPQFFGQYPGRASSANYTGPIGGPNPTSPDPQSFTPSYLKFGEVPQYLVGGTQNREVSRGVYEPYEYNPAANLQHGIYTDPGGHFLGRGNNPDELFVNSPQLQRSYYENLFASGQEQG